MLIFVWVTELVTYVNYEYPSKQILNNQWKFFFIKQSNTGSATPNAEHNELRINLKFNNITNVNKVEEN